MLMSGLAMQVFNQTQPAVHFPFTLQHDCMRLPPISSAQCIVHEYALSSCTPAVVTPFPPPSPPTFPCSGYLKRRYTPYRMSVIGRQSSMRSAEEPVVSATKVNKWEDVFTERHHLLPGSSMWGQLIHCQLHSFKGNGDWIKRRTAIRRLSSWPMLQCRVPAT